MSPTNEVDALLNDAQAASALGLTNPKTLAVWRSTKRYNIPYVKIGRIVRYRSKDLQAFLESHTVRNTIG
jgi:predicted DNA-binding transcriptional regulator AlpA